ncbi:VanZ family protein [Hyphomonas johnsonii]|jgi:VanZ family protein|uniref:VanZ-like domain-containing protein n=1 Tax=Hyphomonas johnsonii MHS-2 TaxID=1280950 RepID=A0A059FQJ3_9PROT|nr:VanZ family protein [Hyphomonas johnsonii]KCZ92882.1 hypothetical protein HJO_08002 [Hyphomonas johnsonii MHS-2]
MRTFLSRHYPLIRRAAGPGAGLVAAAIAVLSLLPGDELPEVHLSDKVEHVIAYAVLATLVTLWLGPRRAGRALLVVMAYGVGMEVAQALIGTGRTPSVLDAGADLVGAGIGIGVAMLVDRFAVAG